MQKAYRQPRLPRHPAVFWSRMKVRWPFLVWLAAVAAVLYAFSQSDHSGQMTGTLELRKESIGPIETARLKELRVGRGQRVEAGDVVAVLDTTQLDTELEVERLQLERQFSQAVRQQESVRQDLLIRQAESEAELAVLNDEVARLDDLLARRLVDSQVVSRLRARQEALRRAVELYPEALEQATTELASARNRLERLERWMDGQGDAPEGELAGLLQLRRESYILRASQAGRVSEVFHQPGDVVPEGGIIATIVGDPTGRIVGYLPESSRLRLQGGEKALAFRPRAPRNEVYSATVRTVGPEVALLPEHISTVPGQILFGLRVEIDLDEPAPFLPGETLSIRIGDEGKSGFAFPWLSTSKDPAPTPTP